MSETSSVAATTTDAPAIQRLFAFQTVLDGVFEQFSDLDESRFDDAVDRALEAIGTFVGADRAYVIRYEVESQQTWMTHEWCGPGTEPSFDDEQGRDFHEAPRQQARLEALEVNEIRDVTSLPEDWDEDRRYLEGQGIAAILEVPLVRHGRLVGVIGLDSTSDAVPWTAEDVTMLRAVAALFAQVDERRVADDSLTTVAAQLRTTVRALHHAEERFAALVDRLPLSVVRVDAAGPVVLRNRAGEDDSVTAAALADPDSPLGRAVAATLQDGTPRSVEFSVGDGDRTEWREASVRVEDDETGRTTSVLVVAQDTTEQHLHERRLVRAATHDHLTGLPNRAMLDGLLEHVAGALGTTLGSVAVLFVDLDQFKMVNDSLGHRHGDAVLCTVAERFQRAVPAGTTVARLGGDEFAVLLEDHDEVAAAEVAGRLLEALEAPLVVAGDEFLTTASVGVAATTDPAQVPELMRWSDVAMYRAKHLGRNRVAVHEERLSGRVAQLLDLDQRLRRAVVDDAFSVAFQPVVDLVSGAVRGAEALVRWTGPDGSTVAAGEFVPLAERNGTILPIGQFVLDDACQTVAGWVREGLVDHEFVVSVNLSARQIDHDGCTVQVHRALERSGLDPAQLCLEVTETAALDDLHRASAVLQSLRTDGVRVAVDDFGTGYGSLQLLQQLPVDRLKLDRSFVGRLPDDEVAGAVTRAVLELADALGLDVVAEGVETEVQRSTLVALGCRTAQGFLFSRAVPADAFALLAR